MHNGEDKQYQILLVDDEPVVRESLKNFLVKKGFPVAESQTASDALTHISKQDIDIMFLDIRMPGMDGLELLERMAADELDIAVIMITGHGTMDTAIQALRLGATDFLKKPIRMQEVVAAIEKAKRFLCMKRTESRLRSTIDVLQRQGNQDGDLEGLLVGDSPAMKRLRSQVNKVAKARCPSVLITGETGTGKEVVARALHRLSSPSSSPFIPVNCPALPQTLVESELFGHQKGAFTGASSNRIGAFELANEGSIFLDEIADLDMAVQAKLLRVLESRTIRRIGGAKEIPVDVMVIAATNCDLNEKVAGGTFRADLLYRLNLIELDIPPLRKRLEDIPLLVDHFVAEFVQRNRGDEQTDDYSVSPAAVEKLAAYHYPGNIRELRNIIERSLFLAESRVISAGDLLLPKQYQDASAAVPQPPEPPAATMTEPDANQEALPPEAVELLTVLNRFRWNRREVADELGISYDALRWRINKYNLQPK